MTTLGIGLALACAAMANLSMLFKHRGACESPEIRLRSPLRSLTALFRSRWWTIGFAVAAVAWVLHVAAMAVAPLSLVQAVIAGGLVLIAFPAQRYFGHRLNRREWLGLGLAAAGLAFLAVHGAPRARERGLFDRHPRRLRGGHGRRRVPPVRVRHPAPRVDLPRRRPRTRLRASDRGLERGDQGAHRGDRRGRRDRRSPVPGRRSRSSAASAPSSPSPAGCSSARRSR